MSNTSSDENLVDLFNNLTKQVDRYFALFIFLFAVVGNILNIMILSPRTLRSNPCVWLFLTSTIADLISILFALTTRIMSGWLTDPTDTNVLLCKLRAFILFTSRTIAFWLVALVTVNRWLASSPNARYRKINTLKNTKISSGIVVLTSTLIYSQMLYCYDANLIQTPLKCYGKTTVCRLISDITYGSISVLLPFILMIVFGLKTMFNINQIRTRIYPQRIGLTHLNNQRKNIIVRDSSNQWKKQDRHLLVMLIVQVIVQGLLTFPQVFAKIYITSSLLHTQTPLNLAIEHFIYHFALLLSFLASGIPFYIYTLCGGSIFRTPLLNLANAIRKKLMF